MAKKKAKAPKKELTKAQKRQKHKRKRSLIFFFSTCMAIVALPTTVFLLVGLLPTFVSFIVDRTKRKAQTMSVGALNLAACSPFLLDLWRHGNSFGMMLDIISDPINIIIMYVGALAGYMVDWTLSGLISGILYKKAEMRVKEIEKKQKELVKRWGKEVTGEIPLTPDGFPLEPQDKK